MLIGHEFCNAITNMVIQGDIKLLCLTDSAVRQLPVRLYNNATAGQGVVQIKYKDTWNFVNGNNWNFRSAAVTCRQLGM